MKIKTKDLIGPALDWAVAKCKGWHQERSAQWWAKQGMFHPQTDWSQGGPIIDREDIALWPSQEGDYFAASDAGMGDDYHGSTYLVAAMRAYVASKLGDEVDVPDELIR